MDILKYYVDLFNENDEECYKNDIDNENAYKWLSEEIPIFECPDKELEKTYYFRWWTYRKHIKSTEDGYIVTEFLPKVPWSSKHNAINAPVGHHICEGRWLKNSKKYLKDYINFFLDNPDACHKYSTWFCYAVWQYAKTTGDFDLGENLLEKMCAYYERWEAENRLEGGMFWSYDNYDAMEFSISGTTEGHECRKGVRPTLNSYMCADAWAIAQFAKHFGDSVTEAKYLKKHKLLKEMINKKLWENGFFRAFHFDEGEDISDLFEKHANESPRELIGYIPWMFNIPEGGAEPVFALLEDENSFYCDFGIMTAERSHKRFLYEANHECLWNGYVWPFATAQTLTALINVIKNYPGGERHRDMFVRLLLQYAKSHRRVREDGKIVPWIDEVRHPLRDDWSSRTILKDWGWREDKGGYERGKDYNHSTFCDLVISGIVGVNAEGDELCLSPNIPKDWDYFKLSNLWFKGKCYSIVYDRTGEGVRIIENM